MHFYIIIEMKWQMTNLPLPHKNFMTGRRKLMSCFEQTRFWPQHTHTHTHTQTMLLKTIHLCVTQKSNCYMDPQMFTSCELRRKGTGSWSRSALLQITESCLVSAVVPADINSQNALQRWRRSEPAFIFSADFFARSVTFSRFYSSASLAFFLCLWGN